MVMYTRVVLSSALLTSIAQASSAPYPPHWSVSKSSLDADAQEVDDLASLEQALDGFSMSDDQDPIRTPSSVQRPTSRAASTSRKYNGNKDQMDMKDVDFRKRVDWWKDPLAQFEDDEDTTRTVRVPLDDGIDAFLEPTFAHNDESPTTSLSISTEGDHGTVDDEASLAQVTVDSSSAGVNGAAPLGQPTGTSRFSFSKLLPPKRSDFQDSQVSVPPSATSSVSHGSSGLPLLLAGLIPSSVRQVLSQVPAMQVLAALILTRQLIQCWPLLAMKKKEPKIKKEILSGSRTLFRSNKAIAGNAQSSAEATARDQAVTENESDYEEEVPEAFRNNPRTRAVFQKKRAPAASEVLAQLPNKASKATPLGSANARASPKAHLKSAAGPTKGKTPKPMIPALSGGWTENLFGPRRPSIRQLMEQVHGLEQSCQQAQHAKSNLELAYEKASWQLQESQTEFDKLKQTTKYLQAQLRDNEEMLERVVQQEQRKAREELLQMKEAMLKVVEREREAMREEFIKQAAELEQVWKQSNKHRRQSSPTRSSSHPRRGEQHYE
jgi:hypothetical protein